MNRPYVNIKTENIVNDLLDVLLDSMNRFKLFEGLVGIILDGGMSRGYADHLSDLDVIIYLHSDQFMQYQTIQTPVALGITKMNGYLFDIKIVDYQEECKRCYDMIALWDLSYAKIIFDPKGDIDRLIKNKLDDKIDIAQAEGLMFDAWWNYELAGNIWIYRGDVLQGHLMLNNAIKPLLGALYIANNEYIPHEKWLLHMSRSLCWTPDNWIERLTKAMGTGDFTLESVIKRQKMIKCLHYPLMIKDSLIFKGCPLGIVIELHTILIMSDKKK